jgi:hypothetical protein
MSVRDLREAVAEVGDVAAQSCEVPVEGGQVVRCV